MGWLLRSIGIVSSFALTSGAALAQTATAVEYYHAAFDHYFVTALPAEIAALDGGAFGGAWARTGGTFLVWNQATGGASPTCRFFSTSFAPKSSHFYTPFAGECTSRKADPNWQYEGDVFFLQLPDASGACAAGTAPLYRLYNDGMGGAPNHRYTASRTTVDQMRGRGWVPEGNGPDVVFACLPAPVGGAAAAAGVWTGTTSANETVRAIVLEDGTYYVLYSRPGSGDDAGVYQGSATIAGGTFSSSNAKDFAMGNGVAAYPATLSGTYVPASTLQLAITDRRGTRSLSATYVSGSGQAPNVATAAGAYAGRTGHVPGSLQATFALDESGNLSGINELCQFTGRVTSRASVDAFDLALHAISGACAFGLDAVGVLYYDAASQQIRGFAPFDNRTDQYFLIGSRTR